MEASTQFRDLPDYLRFSVLTMAQEMHMRLLQAMLRLSTPVPVKVPGLDCLCEYHASPRGGVIIINAVLGEIMMLACWLAQAESSEDFAASTTEVESLVYLCTDKEECLPDGAWEKSEGK